MTLNPEIAACNIVLVGQFNPAIFHPAWLLKEGLISEEENDDAEVAIVHPDICQFSVANLNITIEPQRAVIETQIAPWVRVIDFVGRVFGELLPHTPVSVAGVNSMQHFKLMNADQRMALGRNLAPVGAWGSWAGDLENNKGQEHQGGLMVLTMRQLWYEEDFIGHVQTKVEPSTRIPNNAGVYIEVNTHLQPRIAGSLSGPEIIKYMANNFQSYLDRGDWICGELFKTNGIYQ